MKQLSHEPIVEVHMLIRRPVPEVFQAFIDPEITTKFWFTKSCGRLEVGQRVQWHWEMYGVSTTVDVKAIEPNKRILIEWGAPATTTVEWEFTDRGGRESMVTIRNAGFVGDGDGVVSQALDSTQGFTMVLCGLKAFLEHGVRLNLVADKAPDAHVKRDT